MSSAVTRFKRVCTGVVTAMCAPARLVVWSARQRNTRVPGEKPVRPRHVYQRLVRCLLRDRASEACVRRWLEALGARRVDALHDSRCAQEWQCYLVPPPRYSLDRALGRVTLRVALRFDLSGRLCAGGVVCTPSL